MFGDAEPRFHVQVVSHALLLAQGDDSPNPCSIAFIWPSNANDMPQEWLNVFCNMEVFYFQEANSDSHTAAEIPGIRLGFEEKPGFDFSAVTNHVHGLDK